MHATETNDLLNMDAIEDLYRTYGPMVRRRARTILRNEAAAEDALQDVFTKAIMSRRAFRAAASPRTWLYRVTTNHCLNLIRDGRRRRELLDEKVAPALSVVGDDGLDARVKVRDLMGRVPDDVREVATCFYFAGMTQDEVAEALGISRRTVGNRLRAFRDTAIAA